MMKVLAIASVTVPIIVTSAIAQQTGIKRTVINTFEYPEGYTTVTAVVELGPGTCSGITPIQGSTKRIRYGR